MKRMILLFVAFVPFTVISQILVHTQTMDTATYETTGAQFVPGPEFPYTVITGSAGITGLANPPNNQVFLCLLKKKNTNQYDIFSFLGKIASITAPKPPDSMHAIPYILSQTFINSDTAWECIFNNYKMDIDSKLPETFSVNDQNGNELLSGCGHAFLGYDGQNTYVLSSCLENGYFMLKTWKFRSNVSTSTSHGLAKVSSQQNPLMYYGSSGNLRMTLQPSPGGKTSVQLLDMMGRLTYSKVVDNSNRAVTFTIPSTDVPASPFVSKIENGNSKNVRTMLPTR